ncbi:SWIM zinc finger family protein [Actinokineospora sp.]|uniref:SWIM zinc finger family protein n=1 Tax=Actinokineospora sp. TaxID=1872133 RepID=UPI004037FF15
MSDFHDEDEYDDHLAALFAADEDEDEDEPEADPGGRAVTFPAFPPGRRYGKKFADTWWGNAWIEAMEDTALDPEQLKKGRAHAFGGQVGAITVSPGRVSAAVHDGDHTRPYATVVRFAELTDAGWDRFLDRVATRAGHIAALLDRDMPRDLVGAAADAGVRLLPGYGDLDPECDCPGWDSPCKHAAALSYQMSWLLDRDPFVLLLGRGRGQDELTEELHRRNTRGGATHSGDPADLGTPAAQAWSSAPAPLPEPPELGPSLHLAPLLADVEIESPVDDAAISALAADAAARARDLLSGRYSTAPRWPDAVRLAARADDGVIDRAGRACGRPAEFTRAVHAWRLAGAAGLAVQENSWTPAKDALARARTEFEEAWQDSGSGEPPELTSWRNRWTAESHGVQLRLGEDHQWYPFRAVQGGWVLAGPATDDVGVTLVELLREE